MNHSKNHNANVLKKMEVGNPLINLGLLKLYDEHQACTTDEELANFYHKFLSCAEGSSIAMNFAYGMIAFSTDQYDDPLLDYVGNLILLKDED